MSAAPESIATRPLSPALGAEILGVDLHQALTPAQEAALRKLLDERQVLLFRRQDITVEDQIRVMRLFGKVSDETHDGSFHTFVSNVLPNGLFGDHELIYHSDFAFGEYQPPVISLYATDVGSAAGPTSFANCTRACAELPDALRHTLEGKTVVQVARFAGGNMAASSDNRSRMLGLKDLPPDSNFRMSKHPVLKPHPRTGVPLLFTSVKHTSHIEGFEREESDRIVKELLTRIYAADNTFTHHWQNGDLLIWDNVATQHARPGLAGGGKEQRRTLRRVLVSEKTARQMLGDVSYGSGDG